MNKTPCKVLIIAPALVKGGMERQLAALLQAADKQRYTLSLALFRKKIEYIIPEKVSVINLKKKGKVDIFFFIRLFMLIKNGGFDLIHSRIEGVNEYTMLICGLLKIKPLILEIRNTGVQQLKHYRRMSILLRIFKAPWRVVCNSKKAVEDIRPVLPSFVPTTYIGNGVDINRFKKTDGLKEKLFTIGFVGRIARQKNIEVLIKAAALINRTHHQKFRIYIIGNTKDKQYEKEINKIIEIGNFNDAIVFLPVVDDIEKYYNKFELFVLPSNYEGTPNALLEAMSCECPCLISEGANHDSILAKEFVFDTEDFQQLADKILKIYHLDKKIKQQIGRENREKILKVFSLNTMKDQYQKLWDDM
ncbi:glycosyltransferase [Candidatus Margulisiibacteriota bacterium]